MRRPKNQKHEPDEQTRAMVVAMAINGETHEMIAQALPVSLPTLYKYYRKELDFGMARANAKVADTLYKMALSGRYPAATIFWAKARMGWTEKQEVQVSGDQTIRVVYENGEPTGPSRGPTEGDE